MEAQGWLRAGQGTKRPVFMRGRDGTPQQVGETTEFSDRCWELIMRAHRPQQYGKQAVELSGPNGAPIQPVVAQAVTFLGIPAGHRASVRFPRGNTL